jgi:hypothetical protein
MGFDKCPTHGYRGYTNCCPHVAAAYVADADCPGTERREYGTAADPDPIIGLWLCPACAAGGQWPPSGMALDGEDFPEAVPLSELGGICVECFAGWYKSHGFTTAEPSAADNPVLKAGQG